MRNQAQLSREQDYIGIYEIQNVKTVIAPGELYGMFNSSNRNMSQIAYDLAHTAINLFDKKLMILSSEKTLEEMEPELMMLNHKLQKLDMKDGVSKKL